MSDVLCIGIQEASFEAEVIQCSLPVLVCFVATWSSNCGYLAPILDKVADELRGKLRVVRVDIDEYARTATRYAVMAVPTTMVFRGGKSAGSMAGLITREDILKLVNR